MDNMVGLRSTVNQLVEAWHAQASAQQQLDDFTASHSPPSPPSQFEGLRELLEFDESRRSYQAGFTQHQIQLDAAKVSYRDAANKLQEVLPDDAGLQYIYQGGRQDLEGGRYMIVNSQGEVRISWHVPPEPPPP